jgi:hypothetical protein
MFYQVHLEGEEIDEVYFTQSDPDEVKRSLIDHDGYDSRIVVTRSVERSGYLG